MSTTTGESLQSTTISRPLLGSGGGGGGGLLLGELPHLLNSQIQARQVGALDHCLAVDGNLVALLEEEEGGHGGDAVFLGDGLYVIDVDLGKGKKAGDREGRGHLGKVGIDELARAAPVGVEVGDDILVRREEVVELLVRANVLDLIGHFEIGSGLWESRVRMEKRRKGGDWINGFGCARTRSLKTEEIRNRGG